jgi:hypothetical protein
MRIVAQLIGTLLLVGFVLKYWWLIALVLAALVAWKYGPGWCAGHQATVAAEQHRIAAPLISSTLGRSLATCAGPTGTTLRLLKLSDYWSPP